MSSLAFAKEKTLNFRLSEQQDELLREAAGHTGKSLSAFLLESATSAAEYVLTSRKEIVASPAEWEALSAMLNRPAEDKPTLRGLFSRPSNLVR